MVNQALSNTFLILNSVTLLKSVTKIPSFWATKSNFVDNLFFGGFFCGRDKIRLSLCDSY